MLNSAHALRLEKERERELTSQKEEQTTSLSLADSKTNRLKRQLNDLQQAALGATPEGSDPNLFYNIIYTLSFPIDFSLFFYDYSRIITKNRRRNAS